MWPALLLLLWLDPVTLNQKTGGCLQPQPLCCLGTDHHCRRGSCYCDEFCHVVSDCCSDRAAVCNPGHLPEGSLPPVAQLDAVTDRASRKPKMVLQMVLRMDTRRGPDRSNQDWVQSMRLLHRMPAGPGTKVTITTLVHGSQYGWPAVIL